MPTYEYLCHACNKQFSRTEHIADHGKQAVTCPACKSTNVQRQIAAAYPRTVRKS